MHRPRPTRPTLAGLAASALTSALALAPILGGLAAAVLPAPAEAASAAAPVVAARDAAPSYTVTPLWFSVQVGPDDALACTVVADLYVPNNASPSHRVPAILTTNGFGGSKDDQAGTGRYYASHGYAVLSYSGLGFGGSGCPISLDSPEADGKAARFLVSYLGGETGHAFLDAGLTQPAPALDVVRLDRRDHAGGTSAHDPRVGMIGGSYGGEIQFSTASIDPRVDTLIPLITWNDLSYSLAPNNVTKNGADLATGVTTPIHGATKLSWAGGFSALGVVNGLQNADADQQRLIGCPNFETWVCPSLVTAASTGTLDETTYAKLHDRSVVSFMDKIRVPVLLAQGEGDTLFNLNEAIATYHSLQAQGTPVKMIWTDGGHSNPYPAGEIVSDSLDPRTQYLTGRFKAWFDHYLLGRRAVPTGPRFAYFRDWVSYSGNAKPAYATAPAFPLPGSTTYYLSGSSLTQDAGSVAAGSQAFTTTGGGLPSSYDPIDIVSSMLPLDLPDTDAPGTTASFTTPALTAPLTVVGSPVLHLQVTAPLTVAAADRQLNALTLFVKVLDVAPDGTSSVVRDLVAPARISNTAAPFAVTLPAFAHRFDAGHQLQLVVAGGAANFRGGLEPEPVTIATGSTDQALVLPTR